MVSIRSAFLVLLCLGLGLALPLDVFEKRLVGSDTNDKDWQSIILTHEISRLEAQGNVFEYSGSLAFKNSSGLYFINGTSLGSSTTSSQGALITGILLKEALILSEQAEERHSRKVMYDVNSFSLYTDIDQLILVSR